MDPPECRRSSLRHTNPLLSLDTCQSLRNTARKGHQSRVHLSPPATLRCDRAPSSAPADLAKICSIAPRSSSTYRDPRPSGRSARPSLPLLEAPLDSWTPEDKLRK